MKTLRKACNVRNTGGNREKSCVDEISRSGGHDVRISWSGENLYWVSRVEYDGSTHRLRSSATTSSSRRWRAPERRPFQRQRMTRALSPAAPADWARLDRCSLAPLGHAPSGSSPAPPRPAPPRPRTAPATISRVSSESARAALFSGGSLTAPNWLGPFSCRTRFRSVQPQSLCAPFLETRS